MVTEISISENFLEEYLPRATIEILPPLPCDNFYLPDSGRHVTTFTRVFPKRAQGKSLGTRLEKRETVITCKIVRVKVNYLMIGVIQNHTKKRRDPRGC